MIEALGISMVKNEADVIEAFVRHNLSFMDALVVIDNDSIDGTREILVQLQQEGLPIILFDDPVVAHFQAEIVTATYRKVVPKFKPRFVFLLDADEFIMASSREALYIQLRAMRPGTQAQYCWKTYIPAPTGLENDVSDPLRGITHRKIVEDRWWKPVIVTQPKIDTKLKIQQGNHDVKYAGRSLRKVKLRDVAIAHFPVRSVEQITGKVLVGWIANLERNRLKSDRGYAFQWKALYERIAHGAGLTAADLTLEALKYAQVSKTEFEWPQDVVREPVVPAYQELTARPESTCTPLQKVVRSIDEILTPEADPSGVATAVAFLQNSKRKHKNWRDFARPFTTGSSTYKRLCLDLPPFRHLAQRHCPESVLQIGCGSGAYLKYFAALGTKRIKGVDAAHLNSTFLEADQYAQVDLGTPLDLGETFDLVICLEAINRIPAGLEDLLIRNVVRHARGRIVFLGARPGQPHVDNASCQSISHWVDLFGSAGWGPCLFDSLTLRSLSTFSWFSNDLVVFARDAADSAPARDRLMELDRRETKWDRQRPAVITHPFTETATKLLGGYQRRYPWSKKSR